jgi:hypothetical protein
VTNICKQRRHSLEKDVVDGAHKKEIRHALLKII